MPRHILILGARSPVALEYARAFHKHAHKIYFADCQHFPIGRWSNYATYIRVASPSNNFLQFKIDIKRLIDKYRLTDIIPTYEETFHLAQFKNELSCNVWTSDINLLDQLHNKARLLQLSKGFFHLPDTKEVIDAEVFENAEKLVFKEKYSRFSSGLLIKPSSSQARKLLTQPAKWIAQEFIEGKEFCVFSIWDNGRMKAISFYHPLLRAGKGAGIYFQPVNLPLLEEKVLKFGQSLRFHGQLSFDFILRGENFYIIECNPRATSGLHLLTQDINSIFFTDNTFYRNDNLPKAIKFIMFFTNPTSIFSRQWREASDVIYDRQDLKPFLLQLTAVLELLFVSATKNISPLHATTYDIEWNGEIHATDFHD